MDPALGEAELALHLGRGLGSGWEGLGSPGLGGGVRGPVGL